MSNEQWRSLHFNKLHLLEASVFYEFRTAKAVSGVGCQLESPIQISNPCVVIYENRIGNCPERFTRLISPSVDLAHHAGGRSRGRFIRCVRASGEVCDLDESGLPNRCISLR